MDRCASQLAFQLISQHRVNQISDTISRHKQRHYISSDRLRSGSDYVSLCYNAREGSQRNADHAADHWADHLAYCMAYILCGMSGMQSSWRRLANIGEEGKSLGDREESGVSLEVKIVY